MTTTWHGVTLDDRSAAMMDEVESLLGVTLTPSQGSYSTSVGASAGTHAGGGAIDLSISGINAYDLVYAMRRVGWAAWERTVAEGFSPHVHGIAVGCPDLSPEAADQVTDYFEGRNGLATNAPDDGPRDFVGQTWEGYLAGTDPAGPTRVFRGVQLGIDDVVVTAGSLDPYFGPTGVFNNVENRNDGETVTLTAGDEFYVYLTSGDFDTTDVVSLIYWRLNASGHGTLELAESFDPDYSYSPPFDWTDLGPVVVDTDTLALTATQGIAHTPVEMNGDDGAILLRVTCVSGSVTLDWLVLQVEPPSGLRDIDIAGGHWSLWRIPGTFQMAPTYAKLVGLTAGAGTTTTSDEPGLPATIDDDMEALLPALGDLVEGSWITTTGPFGVFDFTYATAFWHQPNVLIDSYDRVTTATRSKSVMTADWETWPDLVQMPDFLAGLEQGIDYAPYPGAPTSSPIDPLTYGQFQEGDTQSVGWNTLHLTGGVQNYYDPIIGPALVGSYTSAVSSPGDIHFGDVSILALPDDYAPTGDPNTQQAGPDGTEMDWTPPTGSGWSVSVASPFDDGGGGEVGAPGSGWAQADGVIARHGVEGDFMSSNGPAIKLQMPPYRYWIPAWVRSPDALDTTDPEGVIVTWLRQRQRNDGLGNSITRARGASSRQMSLRQRGYR